MSNPVVNSASLQEFGVMHYVFVACFTMCVWDWILSISEEQRMLRITSRQPWMSNGLIAVYMTLRVSVLGWLATNFINGIMFPVPNANRQISLVFDCMTLPVASWLFYIRLGAVYLHDKRVRISFGILWAAVFSVFIFDAVHRHTKFLVTHTRVPAKLTALPYVINTVYDMFVYLAMSWKLAAFSIKGDTWRHRVLAFFKGDGLLVLTKSLLRGGQIYFFTTIVFSIASIVCLYLDQIPIQYRGAIAPPHVSIVSILACQIFRELKLGILPGCLSVTDDYELGSFVFAKIDVQQDRATDTMHTVEDQEN
ncbi:hypothetical protein FIBSPDRAFT_1046176 [Athelia psychrophila]|uniref:DUF6533 domain-containing protein n=1 Tax=Athelia psychrophila TaxID=1759441 RepID=A0A166H504_9AGAM|nr:hypothetical protein FIBSPDRAFT_1055446 [Fibularhizoctonia sp. CBS 109695]KZP18486.1 hypothetical protein FIBSPDRAFT_1046176 [Fibularhizoctonia sp. CBS 109695]